MRLETTIPARQNLRNIEKYIRDEFGNPTAAKRITQKIVKSAQILKTSPYAGFSIKGRFGVDTPLRILVSGNYLIVYEVKEETNFVEILKIYHGKQNYIKDLFPDYEDNEIAENVTEDEEEYSY